MSRARRDHRRDEGVEVIDLVCGVAVDHQAHPPVGRRQFGHQAIGIGVGLDGHGTLLMKMGQIGLTGMSSGSQAA